MTRPSPTGERTIARYGAEPNTHSASCVLAAAEITASNDLNITRTALLWT